MSDIPLFDVYQGVAQAQRSKKDIKESEGLIAGFEAKEQEALGRRKYGVGEAWNQYLAASRQDKAADIQRQAAAQQEATAIGALKAGGAKALLGGLGAAQAQTAQQMAGIEAGSQQRQQSALAQFAGVQQQAMDANVRLAGQDVTRAQTQFDLETQRKRDLIQQKREGVDQAVGGGMDMAQSYFTGKHGGNMFSTGGFLSGLFGGDKKSKYGGKYASGGVQKTPGEFSHAKNPIDIMKEGAKIGEMTGGEYIFNPRQASTLQSLASKGGSPLHKYVRNLLNEFDKR